MLLEWIRIVNGSSDVSLDNQNNGTIAVDGAATLYIGKRYAFNNFFVDLNTANTNSVTMTVDYFDGKNWIEAVDLLDGTSGFTKNGVVQFSPNKKHGWSQTADTSEGNAPASLSGFTIYDLYWLRITFSSDLSASSALNQITYKFTEQEEVELRDNDISEFLTSFGQTDWLPQILAASLEVAKDLQRKKVITDASQILRFDDVSLPTAWKTLFLIYLNLGDSYRERRKEISNLYESSFDGIYSVDKNDDAVLDKNEASHDSARMFR